MFKQRLKGLWQQMKGSSKLGYGRLSGDRKMKAEGTLENGVGRVREGVGRVVDDAKREVRYEGSDSHSHL